MTPQNVVEKMASIVADKKKLNCEPLKINFETCMKENEDNVIECNKLKISYEECLRKMDILNYIK